MPKTKKHIKNDKGFTLVELMVTVFLTAIAVISIYRGYTAFSRGADAQQQVIEMQQNLRIGMARLVADIRRAGMNEEDVTVAGFIDASDSYIEFSMDLGSANGPVIFATDGEDNDDDGDPDEDDEARIGDDDVEDDGEKIIYYVEMDSNGNGVLDPDEDINGNSVLDEGLLQRQVWDADLIPPDYGPAQTIISNVEWLQFDYWDAGEPAATPTPIPAAPLDPEEDPPGSGIFWLTDPDLEKIDRVEITLVVRTTNEDYRYTNRETYWNLQGTQSFTVTPPDNFRRRAFTMSVQIRNNI